MEKKEKEMIDNNEKTKIYIVIGVVITFIFSIGVGVIEQKDREIERLEQRLKAEKINRANTKNEVVVLKKYIKNNCK